MEFYYIYAKVWHGGADFHTPFFVSLPKNRIQLVIKSVFCGKLHLVYHESREQKHSSQLPQIVIPSSMPRGRQLSRK
jgi:hypothetical protein